MGTQQRRDGTDGLRQAGAGRMGTQRRDGTHGLSQAGASSCQSVDWLGCRRGDEQCKAGRLEE